MLIGISGKMGSGKDTVGKIIQYLQYRDTFNVEIPTSEKNFDVFRHSLAHKDQLWKIKKFADAIKDMTCIILGCTRDQLEDREFKEKELGEDWARYYATMRGFTTKTEISKSMIKDYSEAEDDLGPMYLIEKEVLTPRKILQLLGTEAGRNIIHPNIWVNASLHKYYASETVRPISEENKAKYPVGMAPDNQISMEYPKWVFTDTRFPNEAKAIKEKGGILIRVNRNTKNLENLHPSETALDNYQDWDYVIDNNGTIEELISKVQTVLDEI